MKTLSQELEAIIRKHGRKARFTVEFGRGETYTNSRPTLYGHWPYERSSVLRGRDCRAFINSWNSPAEATAALVEARSELVKLRLKFTWEDCLDCHGSSHVPIAQVVAHIPDDTDY